MKYPQTLPIIILLLFYMCSLYAKENPNTNRIQSILINDRGQFNGNRIASDLENNGMIVSQRITGHSGLEWPKGNHTYAVFASGLWMAGRVNGEIRTACTEYGPERVPGAWGSDPEDPGNKLYIVDRSDLTDPLQNNDFQYWPVDQGAPWVDEDKDGIYTPLPDGSDHPQFLGDQVIWYVSNDGDSTAHRVFQTVPLGIEVQTTIFGMNRKNFMGDIMFVRELIINKSDHSIDNAYVGIWVDPDLGDAGDDFVGCDTTLGMGICYNDGPDQDFAGYSGGTPALGYDFFQGPLVPAPGDTAFAFGRSIPGYKNRKMTAFMKFIGTSDPTWSDPNTPGDVYNRMRGLKIDGTPFPLNISGGSPYVHPGDPTLDTGPGDTEYVDSDIHSSGDRRFLMSSGPFTMAPGDSQEVVYGIFLVADGDPLNSYLKLKEVDQVAQRYYDSRFKTAANPPAPIAEATPYADEIILSWDRGAEDYHQPDPIDLLPVPVAYDTTWSTIILDSISVAYDTVIVNPGDTTVITTIDTVFYYQDIIDAIDTTFQGEPTAYFFEGYNVYQLDDPVNPGQRMKIATFDRINGVTQILDDVFDPLWGLYVTVPVQDGTDSGIQRYIRITTDALMKSAPLQMNREYYFGVTSYGYNRYGFPKTLESSLQILSIRPQSSPTWTFTDSSAQFGANLSWTHTEGISDGTLELTVVNPRKLTGDEYAVYFSTQYYYRDADGVWKFTNYPDSIGKIVSGKIADCSGSSITAAAIVSANVGTVDLTFTFDMDCGSNWVDGIMIDLPDNLTINSWDQVGDCNYPQYGQNCSNMAGILDATTNTIFWGDSSRSQIGSIEGGTTFSVNIDPPAGYPFSIDWQVWDDGYDGTIIDGSGVTTVTELGYEFKSILEWNVKDNTTGEVLAAHQTMQSGFLQDAIVNGVFVEGTNELGARANPIVDGVQVAANGAPPDLKWVGVTANSTGTLASPLDALAYWYFPSYLIADGDYTDQQPTTGATWFLNVGPMYGVDEDAFMHSVFAYTGGYGVTGGSGIQWLVPDDFEIRFTGNGKALDYWGTGTVIDVPFEWWNVGDPNDPGDDFQMIPYLLDEDGNGEWNLQFGSEDADHGSSGGLNDPWTDRVYIMSPVDETPGTQGYDNFMAGAASGSAVPTWYAQPGSNDPGGPMDAWLAFARIVFMNWNGGDVVAATSPADYNAQSPETGTIFYIAMTKPNWDGDVFTYSTSGKTGETVAYSPVNIKVWPNPYFGYNPEERNPNNRRMQFTHLPESGTCTIRIFDLAGNPVRRIDHNDAGSQYEVWDLRNNYGKWVASGMYIALVETESGSSVLKLAVIK
ncbi:MAG: T9SS type A sorting domain-containing protein [FCB group bacterium]|nr:T9SS type A sorting domain-containing protein [FCB group bacterium]